MSGLLTKTADLIKSETLDSYLNEIRLQTTPVFRGVKRIKKYLNLNIKIMYWS